MANATDTKRLTDAINALAAVILEIVIERVERRELASGWRKAPPPTAQDPILTKKELALRLQVGQRTISDWMSRRKIPYIKIGTSVRFMWSEVESALKKMEIRARE